MKIEIDEEIALLGLISFIGLAYWLSLPKATRKKIVKILQEEKQRRLKGKRKVLENETDV